MDNQHRKITGYRDLSEKEIELMNEIKEEGERVRTLIEKVEGTLHDLAPEHVPTATYLKSLRCVTIGTQHLQTGFMWLTRAVAKPERF